MICVIKHTKSGKFITSAMGSLKEGEGVISWGGDTSSVKFGLTDNIQRARLIEDPDIDKVKTWGCEVIPVKSTKATLKVAYRIIEHE